MGYIYKITNTINDKSYIGISIHPPGKGRIRNHLSGYGNCIISNAVKKYGRDAFTYEILENNIFPELLPDLEIAYIKKYQTITPLGYNLTHGGEGTLGYRFSAEQRRRLSETRKGEKNSFFGKKHSPETRLKIGEAGKGRKHTTETRLKIGEAGKGRKHTTETRRRISEAQKGKSSPNKGKTRSAKTCGKISKTKGKAFEKRLGMPLLAFHIRINLFLRARWSFRRIAKGLRIPSSTVHKYKDIASLLKKT
ncbi:MAG: hypothetical protein F4X55_04270 [Candidatus Dadabacteria bacterium]|nr:hypothetical protein [Candidatus Dadabacteria bacterium]